MIQEPALTTATRPASSLPLRTPCGARLTKSPTPIARHPLAKFTHLDNPPRAVLRVHRARPGDDNVHVLRHPFPVKGQTLLTLRWKRVGADFNLFRVPSQTSCPGSGVSQNHHDFHPVSTGYPSGGRNSSAFTQPPAQTSPQMNVAPTQPSKWHSIVLIATVFTST